MPVTLVKKVGANDIKLAPTWRKRWDSNPRAREDYLISSQARYDHFDTAPYADSTSCAGSGAIASNSIIT